MNNGFAADYSALPVDTTTISTELSYDDTIPYEEQLPTEAEALGAGGASSLANRIGNTKVYLLSDTSAAAVRLGKRKHVNDEESGDINGEPEDEMDTDEGKGTHYIRENLLSDTRIFHPKDPTTRANAILLCGPPIAHLPTARLFEYAAHFDVHPLGLEWIDDNTCIFVFKSKTLARAAFRALQKQGGAADAQTDLTTSTSDLVSASPIPVSLWPPEERINQSLGVGQGLRGTILIRWARVDDVKKRGAKKESQFYRKHGEDAGKETVGFGVAPAGSSAANLARRMASTVNATLEERITVADDADTPESDSAIREWDKGKPGVRSLVGRKRDMLGDDHEYEMSRGLGQKRKRSRRDEEMDSFLREDGLELDDEYEEPDATEEAEPPSKMRSDYIAKDGRTVIGSVERGIGLVDRITAPLPRRARGGRNRGSGEKGTLNTRLGGDVDLDINGDGVNGHGRKGRPRAGQDRRRDRRHADGVRPGEPPRKKTREELDEELEAFLNDRP
ncbi:hypothetical protein AMATHDRAFT_70684 [Amanita thiersii Skay4041]|uniref:Chromatin target of PRMT1 protein C-terminal domain-containing protein n=1 Tax=Amanita thiersii Skay4041 TaxID=703135 RepID=A0A2A9NEA9_9AGAR|nr:hypothetical protein AMATHDRAFT_70684 [Amanita thiersii Skay4041]